MIEVVFILVLVVLVLLGVCGQIARIADAVEAQNLHYEIGAPVAPLEPGPEVVEKETA